MLAQMGQRAHSFLGRAWSALDAGGLQLMTDDPQTTPTLVRGEAAQPLVFGHRMPALKRWTDDFLVQACGEEIVEVMAWRNADPLYEIRLEHHRTNMRFSDYLNTARNVGGNDFYITANNGLLRRPGTQKLFEDIGGLPYLDHPRSGDNTFFWFGGAGTVTPLHHDTIDLILAQVRGRKRITLFAPSQTPLLYNSIGVFSDVDCESPDLERHPLYRQAHKEVVLALHPGDAIFIPKGWWHHVRALDVSISVSFTHLL